MPRTETELPRVFIVASEKIASFPALTEEDSFALARQADDAAAQPEARSLFDRSAGCLPASSSPPDQSFCQSVLLCNGHDEHPYVPKASRTRMACSRDAPCHVVLVVRAQRQRVCNHRQCKPHRFHRFLLFPVSFFPTKGGGICMCQTASHAGGNSIQVTRSTMACG